MRISQQVGKSIHPKFTLSLTTGYFWTLSEKTHSVKLNYNPTSVDGGFEIISTRFPFIHPVIILICVTHFQIMWSVINSIFDQKNVKKMKLFETLRMFKKNYVTLFSKCFVNLEKCVKWVYFTGKGIKYQV